MERFGIENLKAAAKWGITFGTHVGAVLKDGKVTLPEGFGLLPDFMAAGTVVATGKDLKNELSDLSGEEAARLADYVSQEFPEISTAEIQNKITKGIHLAADIYDYVLLYVPKDEEAA